MPEFRNYVYWPLNHGSPAIRIWPATARPATHLARDDELIRRQHPLPYLRRCRRAGLADQRRLPSLLRPQRRRRIPVAA